MILQITFFVLGLILLIKGADWLVEGASSLAKQFNVSELAIGLTVVAFGTSMPELVVNAFASYNAYPEIVFGNVIGSNNFNLLVILGIAGLITPLRVRSSTVWKEIPFSFFAVLLLILFSNDFTVRSETHLFTRIEGGVFLLLFALFLFYISRQLKNDPSKSAGLTNTFSHFKITIFILFGLAGLIAGGKLVVDNAVEIARVLGLSEKIIGLTVIAAGTSLPELATSVVAASRKNIDIAVGNIVGSNIFNILFILPVSAFIRPIRYNPAFNTDVMLLAGGTLFLFLAMFTGHRKKLDRWEAGILLAAFILYTVTLI